MPPARQLLIRAARALRQAAASAPLRLAYFACLALLASWPVLSTAGDLNTFRDAQVIGHYESVARLAVLRYHQAPLWDPYYCGGMYLLGTPQARFVAPSFLATLLFGESRGEAVTGFGMLVIGLEGAFRYARARRASSLSSVLAAPVFGLSGMFAVAPQNGWVNFYGFALVPWIVLGFRSALRGSARGAVLAAAGVAWCTGFGGTYAVPMVALWCGLELLEALLQTARGARGARGAEGARPAPAWRALRMALVVASLGAGLAAVRLWPVIESILEAPRVIGGSPGSDYTTLGNMLFRDIDADDTHGQFFIGLLAVPAAAFAFRRASSVVLGFYAGLWAWLSAGYGVHPSLFAATQSLPVYGTLRYPERYLILLALVVSALGARGLSLTAAFARRAPRRRWAWRSLHVAFALALLVDIAPLALQHTKTAALRELKAQPVALDQPFHQSRGNRFELAYYTPMQRGSLSCWDAYPVPESPLLEGNLNFEERLADPRAGKVTERSWSPNRIDLDVTVDRPARLRVNQNWHAGWRSNVGTVSSERGLLVVDLPAGSHGVALRFQPRSATGGLLVSLASLVAALLLLRRGAADPRSLAVSLLLPAAIVLAVLVLDRSPTLARRVPLAPTGEAIVVDEATSGLTHLGVRFKGGMTLVAGGITTPHPRAGEVVVLELDWTREPDLDPGLGVFVHLEPSKGDSLNGDHVELSQSLVPDFAPSGKVLRDLLPITLPADAGDKHWTVYAGLWRVRRDGERVAVGDAGAASVDKDRVTITSFDVK